MTITIPAVLLTWNVAFQFIAAFILFAGLWLAGSLHKSGPLLAVIAEAIFFAVFIQMDDAWGAVFLTFVLFFVQLRMFWRWHRSGVRW